MKIRLYLSIGLVGCKREEIVDVPDDELEGMNEIERADHFDEYAKDWMFDCIEYGWREQK